MNAELLLAKIREEGISMGRFLQSIHMSSSTWNKKIGGIYEFDRDEMQRIIVRLKLKEIDVTVIFFGRNVS
ncbi:hypothetical protein [Megasphaera sueciensis]|uniref:hypothetical protein n=1 Tax=Megasphaera sueciensis TaxID=349094 RepID=UPI003D041087